MDSQVRILPAQPGNVSTDKGIALQAPAKINLYLNITGTYADGYHRIESVVNRVSLYDSLFIQPRDDGHIDFFCDDALLNTADNICVRAARLLQENTGSRIGVTMLLSKHIPAGSGLGGASSDGAATLEGINRLLRLGLSRDALLAMGRRLGMDVNFFIHNTPWALLKRRGDVVEPLDIKEKYRYLVVFPHITLSTRMIYESVNAKLTKHINNVRILCYALKKRDYLLVEKTIFNRLEKDVLRRCEELKGVKQFFARKDVRCFLTGSGSAFFTILKENQTNTTGKSLMRTLRNQGWRVDEVQTS